MVEAAVEADGDVASSPSDGGIGGGRADGWVAVLAALATAG